MPNFVNQRGESVVERHIHVPDATPCEVAAIVAQLLTRMNLHVVETNATKYGNTEIEVRDDK